MVAGGLVHRRCLKLLASRTMVSVTALLPSLFPPKPFSRLSTIKLFPPNSLSILSSTSSSKSLFYSLISQILHQRPQLSNGASFDPD
ncbi:unnamed protein product [Linum trigynum]|uniref:Uncharacterized protein n=1 Tax=Linum trigynum TaxID=586398 RepID=A0AAV2F0Q5_9ROSI